MFQYLTDKDVFECRYEGHLTNQSYCRGETLGGGGALQGKLKVERGPRFTQKLDGLFYDSKLPAEAMEGYYPLSSADEAASTELEFQDSCSCRYLPFHSAPLSWLLLTSYQ